MSIDQLVANYRSNPQGIRLSLPLERICLHCGNGNNVQRAIVQGLGPRWFCGQCQTHWHSSHCWSCEKHGRVDSRDPDTPPCPLCSWNVCAYCQACHINGCANSKYSREHRYIDTISKAELDAMRDRQEREDLEHDAMEYYGRQLDEDFTYDEEMGMFYDGDNWYPR